MAADERETRFRRNELGLYVPDDRAVEVPRLPHSGTYITYSDIAKRDISEEAIVERLAQLSAEECLYQIADISTRLFSATNPAAELEAERQIIRDLIGGELGDLILVMLEDPRWTRALSEQQLVHLARLVVLHADGRPHDDWAGGTLYDEWITCLIGVTDLLDADLVVEDPEQRIAWELRQAQLNHHEDQLPLTAIHHEIYEVLWRDADDPRAAEAERAFEQHTNMSIGNYFAVGSTLLARFIGRNPDEFPGVFPSTYFAKSDTAEELWRPFFELNAGSIEQVRTALLEEEQEYGKTTYGSLTFERLPLVEVSNGGHLPISVEALKRRVSQGVFHILFGAAREEGRDPRYYTSAFGPVFQRSVEATFRRAVPMSSPGVAITADKPYGGRSRRRQSSDVILGDRADPVFVEVVSGPLQIATSTRGDLETFGEDVDRLVVSKAKQLDQSIRDFFDGPLAIDGADPATVRHVWPVIVTSHAFPQMPWVMEEVEARVRAAGHLVDNRIGPLAIVSAEDLFFCEGFMQQGRSFLSLIRGWRSGRDARHSFKNSLIDLGGGRAPGSDHFERRYSEALSLYVKRLLGQDVSPEAFLEHGRCDEG